MKNDEMNVRMTNLEKRLRTHSARSKGIRHLELVTHWAPVIRHFSLLLILLFFAVGCSSSKPPPPKPESVTTAERSAWQAEKQSKAENWLLAAREWKLTADKYALLNDQARQAIALHNLGQAESQMGQFEQAHRDLEQALQINQKLGRTEEWWRDQLTLLEIEAQPGQAASALEERFKRLVPILPQVKNPAVRGLFLNELALFQKSQGETGKAGETFKKAGQELQTAKDELGLATVTANEALLAEQEKNFSVAVQRWQAALRQFEAQAAPRGITTALAGLGRNTLAMGQDLAKAEDYLRRAAHNYRTLKSRQKEAETLELLAKTLEAEGRNKEAEPIRAEVKSLLRSP